MRYYANVNSENIVTSVLIVNLETEEADLAWLAKNFGGTWLRTYRQSDLENGVDSARNGLPAEVGSIWDNELQAFYPPKPFDSWTFDQETLNWIPPLERPEGSVIWDEENYSWVEV